MSSAQRDAPEVVIKNAIRDGWDPTNVEGITPYVHQGWLESEEDGYYEVTVSNPEESPVDGGDTGYSGIDPTGAGPTQMVGGGVNVNVWSNRGRTGQNGTEANPRKAAFMFKTEVERILHESFDGRIPDGSGGKIQTDFSFLAPQGARRFVEDDEEPVLYRYEVTAGYGYDRRP